MCKEEGGVQQLRGIEDKWCIEEEWCIKYKREKNIKCKGGMQENCEADRAVKILQNSDETCKLLLNIISL
jgi:hypothetical protein